MTIESRTMLYLGIDQPARQITVLLRNDHGGVVLAQQGQSGLLGDCPYSA